MTRFTGADYVLGILERLFCFRRLRTEAARASNGSRGDRYEVEHKLKERNRVLRTIHRINVQLAGELELDTLVQHVTEAALELTSADAGAFFYHLQDLEASRFLLDATVHPARHDVRRVELPLFLRRPPAIRRLRNDGQADSDTDSPPGGPLGMPGVRHLLTVPIVSRDGRIHGGLVLGRLSNERFTEQHEQLMRGIAAQTSVAMDNARLYAAAQRELEERRRAEEALREAARHKDEFLAMLAHELRNPLAPIRNAVQVLELMQVKDEVLVEMRDIISRQVAHMAQLVDDLLDVSRIARGKIQLKREYVDLSALVRRTAEDLRGTFLEQGIALSVEVPASAVMAYVDPTRISQALGNLLQNARKFTDRGGRVHTSLMVDPQHEQATIRVQDTGVGMDSAFIQHLFEPFRQADHSLDRSAGGLGLGLATVKGLVDLHGGTVRAASAGPGQGSEFIMQLPLADQHSGEETC